VRPPEGSSGASSEAASVDEDRPASTRRRTARLSIRAVLIALLVPGLIGLLAIDSWNDYCTLADITEDAYDNALLEPARVLESSIEMDDGGELRMTVPLYAQAMLESRAGLRKYFSIEAYPDGQWQTRQDAGVVLAGLSEMPRPPRHLMGGLNGDGRPVYYDAVYRNDPVRVVAMVRDIYRGGRVRHVGIIVAESVGRRDEVEQAARSSEISRDLRMLALVAVLVWFGVAWAMRPLARLRNEIRSRSTDDLTPLDAGGVPIEVVPLVEAVNHHVERHRRVLDQQTRFLEDASHQLRTPLAIMLTQTQFALREKDPAAVREGLSAVVQQLGQTRRLTEQLLSIAHASQEAPMTREPRDLRHLARQVVVQYLPLAREKQQDLGWSGTSDDSAPVWAVMNEAEVHEALSNLIHNAIHYAPIAATITVAVERVGSDAVCSVADDGPGIAPALRERVFARFDRAGASDARNHPGGSGLGLAIARAYARRNGGDIVLLDGEANALGGHGLRAELRIPATY